MPSIKMTSRCLTFLVCLCVLCPVVVSVYVLNGTGGSFPKELYAQSSFFYQFVDPNVQFTYYGPDSTAGKCNVMGYWSDKNNVQVLNNQLKSVPSSWTTTTAGAQNRYPSSVAGAKSFVVVETQLCQDTCNLANNVGYTTSTPGQCPYDSCTAGRVDAASRKPLVDLAASDSLPVLYASQAASCLQTKPGKRLDRDFFPDLQVYPAVAGAVVPIFNIPELTPHLGNSSLILGRLTVMKIFSGKIKYWNDAAIIADNDPSVYPLASAKIQSIMKNLNKPIKSVVRYDSSGTSEVFTSALALMDPPCASMGAATTGLTIPTCQNWQDTSFQYQIVGPGVAGSSTQSWSLLSGATCTPSLAGTGPGTCGCTYNPADPLTLAGCVGSHAGQSIGTIGSALAASIAVPGSSKPTWCGRRTDEMFTMAFTGCNGDGTGTGNTVTIAVIHPNGKPDTLTFACDAPEATVQALFGMTAYPGSTPVAATYTDSSTSPSPFKKEGMTASRSSNRVTGVYKDNLLTPWSLNGQCVGSISVLCAAGGRHAGASSSVKVIRSGSGTSYVYTVGYWDPVVVNNNWYTPRIISAPTGSTAVSIKTFQDGGISMGMNGGWVGKATAQVISFFLLSSLTTPLKFAFKTNATSTTYTTTNTIAFTPAAPSTGFLNDGATVVTGGYLTPAQLTGIKADLNAQIVAAAVKGQATAGAISDIIQMDQGKNTAERKSAVGLAGAGAKFVEYQITFATVTITPTYLVDNMYGLKVVDANGADLPLSVASPTASWDTPALSSLGLTGTYSQGVSNLPVAWATTLQTYNAAPLQYSPFYVQPSTLSGDVNTGNAFKKITCYARWNAFQPLSFYSGSGNGGVVSDVLNRPYAIGYSVLGEAISRNLNIAKMINKAGSVVRADENSVAYAVMDKGGSIDPEFNYAQLGDASSSQAWPISGFTYWLLRKQTHIGDCGRRQAAMSYLHNFYNSPSVTMAANQLGFATLPGFMATTQLEKMKAGIYCNDGKTLALQQYITTPTRFLGPVMFKRIITEYIDAFKVVDPSALLDCTYTDDSRSIWTQYTASPSSFAGVFTMFATRAEKLATYTDPTLTTNAFAHVAVVPVFRFTLLSTPKVTMTSEIIGGILSGDIKLWNDPLIAAANPAFTGATTALTLPAKSINVVVRGDACDANAIMLRFLYNRSPMFKAKVDAVSPGKVDFYQFDFPHLPLAKKVYQNDRVDGFVTDFEYSFGYYVYSDVSPPTATVAQFCADAACTGGVVNPVNNGVPLDVCQHDPTTAVTKGSHVDTFDLSVSTAAGCYPVVGTIDYTIQGTSDPSTCKLRSPANLLASNMTSGTPQYVAATTFKDRIAFSSWLYKGSATAAPLFTQFAVAATTNTSRHNTLTELCYINCAGSKVGYDYCQYKDCSWTNGDYVQVQSACDPDTLMYTVTYELTKGTGAACIQNPANMPPASIKVDCTSVAIDSYLGKLANALSILGMVITAFVGVFAVVHRQEKVLRKSQPVFIYLSIIGAFLMNLSIQAFIGENKNSSCVLRPWAIDISSTIMFSPLLMKLHRIDVLFRMSKKLKKIKIPDYKVALQVVGLCCVDLVILILWSTIQLPYQRTWPYMDMGLLKPITYDACSTTLSSPFECVMIAWKACLLGAGVYKAICTWDHPSDIAEVKHFFLAIYNVSVVGGAMYFFSMFGAQNPATFMIMRCVGIFVSSTLPTLIIMVPKFTVIQYKQITGKSLWAVSGRSSGASDKGSRASHMESQIEVVQNDSKLQQPIQSVHIGMSKEKDANSSKVTIDHIDVVGEKKTGEV